jgi:hypothetical protein
MLRTRFVLQSLIATALSACSGCTAQVSSPPEIAAPSSVAVTVYPARANVPPGGSQPFAATVTGTAKTAVTWSIQEGAAGGTVSSTGLYAAPANATLGATYRILASSATDPTVVGSSVVTIASSPATPSRYLGVNLPFITPGASALIFGNILKHGRPWTDANDVLIPLDSHGWPTKDARIGFLEGNRYPSYLATSGYKLRFTGQATLGGYNITISNKVYDSATNTTTADVAVSSVDNTWITFSSTKRLPTDAAGNGITNVSLLMPGYSASDYLNRDFVAAVQPFSLFRLMSAGGPGYDMWGTSGAVGVMGNLDSTWSTRQRPAVGYTYNGPAWEEWVILANLTGKDIWVCIPYHVDADYVTKLAQLLRYGSDGINPYTTATHDPSTWTPGTTSWYPGLLPERTVNVEFSNELWNLSYGYPDAYQNESDYTAEISAGDPHHLNFDGKGNSDRRVAWKTVWISQLFRSVWGDAAMGNRVRIVLPDQGDWGNWSRHRGQLTYIDGVWGTGSSFSTIDGITVAKQPVPYYVSEISGSMYVHAANFSTVDTAFADMNTSLSTAGGLAAAGENNSVYERIGYADAMAAKYPGLTFSSYESGIEIPVSAVMTSADADVRMKTLHHDLLTAFYAKPNARALVYFWLVGNSSLDVGLSTDLRNTSTMRWQAVKEFAGP